MPGGGGTPSLYELDVGMYEAELKGMVFEPFSLSYGIEFYYFGLRYIL